MTLRRRAAQCLAVAGVLLAWDAPTCRAAATGGSENIEVAFVSERTSIRPGEPFQVGLRMKMRDGWHTYWKHPGDAGLPLRIEWTLPAGFTAAPIEWPAPERIPTGGLMSYGYGRDVLLLVTITPPARVAAESVSIAGAFDWLECKDVCLSGSARLDLTLPVSPRPTSPGRDAPLFAEARARLPHPSDGWTLSARAGSRAIELSFRPPPGVNPRGGYLFIDQPLVVEHAASQGFERAGDGYRLTATPAENAGALPRSLTGVLVLDGVERRKGSAIAVNVEAAPGDPSPAPAPATRRNWPTVPLYAILAALAGIAVAVALRRRAVRS